jgi:FkbM family methyltransferase
MESHQTTRRRLVRGWVRVAILALAVVLTGTFVLGSGNAEYQWFKAAYGPSHYSEHAEEWIVRDFFHDRRSGTFVDVGSNHYRSLSNTYYLEQTLGWSGIAIDAQQEYGADYAKYRPRTKFFSFFVSDRSDATESLFVPRMNKLVASSSPGFSGRFDSSPQERKVATITLNDLLDRTGVAKVDFLSMDIELAEPKALAGFDIERFKPALIVVESHAEIRQHLLDYFVAHRYSIVGRYLRADPDNLWFAPSDAPLPDGLDINHTH